MIVRSALVAVALLAGSAAGADASKLGGFYLERDVGRVRGDFSLGLQYESKGLKGLPEIDLDIPAAVIDVLSEPGSVSAGLSFPVSGREFSVCGGYRTPLFGLEMLLGGRLCGHFGTVEGSFTKTTSDGRSGVHLGVKSKREFSLTGTLGGHPVRRWENFYVEAFAGASAIDIELTAEAWTAGRREGASLNGWALGPTYGVRMYHTCPKRRQTWACPNLYLGFEETTYKGQLDAGARGINVSLPAKEHLRAIQLGFGYAF